MIFCDKSLFLFQFLIFNFQFFKHFSMKIDFILNFYKLENIFNNWRMYLKKLNFFLNLIFIILFLACSSSTNNNVNALWQTYDSNSTPGNMNVGDWSAAQWQWFISMPANTNSLLDSGDCGENQSASSRVWFLGGSINTMLFKGKATIERNCQIPYSKGVENIFIPIATVIRSISLGDNPDSLEILALKELSNYDVLRCEINGENVVDGDLFKYKFTSSGRFDLNFPDNNVYGITKGFYSKDAYCACYGVIINAQSTGTLQIHWHAESKGNPDRTVQDVTYTINLN